MRPKILPAMRGSNRTGPIGTIVPGDDVEVARDIQRLWAEVNRLRGRPAGGGSGSGHHELIVTVDGLGRAPSTGVQGDVPIDFDGAITGWILVADQSGSVVVDIWKDVLANHPPTVADTITASAKPTLSSAVQASSSTLTGWTTAVADGDVLRFNIDSCSGLTKFTLTLSIEES